jgi:nondiscriminating aspartyl-tRNA synthetase
MVRTWSTELAGRAGQRVRLAGWMHHQRRLSQVTFALVRDGRGIAQVVIEDPAVRSLVAGLEAETVLEVEGVAVRAPAAPGGAEVRDPTVTVLVEPSAPLPFELRRPVIPALLPTILDHAAVSLRHPRRRAIARVAAASVAGFRLALDDLGFVEVHTPKVVASATEGGANVFELDWFGSRAYLAQSPQFYKQTMVGVFERVYEVGPVFRAEKHDTTRHLAEYVSMDAELGFIEDHRDVIAVLRAAVAGMILAVGDRAGDALGLLGVVRPSIPDEIPSVDFTALQELIESATGEAVVGEPDLAPAHERWVGEWARREHGSEFVCVTGYPMSKRPFYTHPDPAGPAFSRSFDLIFRGVELVTGGQRLHRYDDYLTALTGTDLSAYEGYLEAFRHGMPPHGGFAIGLARWVAGIVGAANVREATLFPRDRHRLVP